MLVINAPEQVRKDGNFYKYLKLEQETERAHMVSTLATVEGGERGGIL